MTRAEYDRYRIFHRVKDNVIDIYDFKEWRYVSKMSVPVPGAWEYWKDLPYLGHLIEWTVNFQPN